MKKIFHVIVFSHDYNPLSNWDSLINTDVTMCDPLEPATGKCRYPYPPVQFFLMDNIDFTISSIDLSSTVLDMLKSDWRKSTVNLICGLKAAKSDSYMRYWSLGMAWGYHGTSTRMVGMGQRVYIKDIFGDWRILCASRADFTESVFDGFLMVFDGFLHTSRISPTSPLCAHGRKIKRLTGISHHGTQKIISGLIFPQTNMLVGVFSARLFFCILDTCMVSNSWGDDLHNKTWGWVEHETGRFALSPCFSEYVWIPTGNFNGDDFSANQGKMYPTWMCIPDGKKVYDPYITGDIPYITGAWSAILLWMEKILHQLVTIGKYEPLFYDVIISG